MIRESKNLGRCDVYDLLIEPVFIVQNFRLDRAGNYSGEEKSGTRCAGDYLWIWMEDSQFE